MEYAWDEAKRQSNLAKQGVDLASLTGFEWGSAQARLDTRKDYDERRWISLGRIGQVVHVPIFTRRRMRVRVTSLRVANRKKIQAYETNARSADR
jgi:uncharacterized protein